MREKNCVWNCFWQNKFVLEFFWPKKIEKFFGTTSTTSTTPMASTNTHLNSNGLLWTPMDSNELQWTPMDSNGLQWPEPLSSRYAVSNLHLQWPPMGSNGQHLSAQDMLYQISTSNGLQYPRELFSLCDFCPRVSDNSCIFGPGTNHSTSVCTEHN